MTADGTTGLLVGFGSIGRRHLTNLGRLGVKDWAVVHTGAGTLPFDPPADMRVYPTLARALASERPDFALVTNPTALHVSTAIACAEHGCDLLLEKPISNSLDGIDELVDAVERNGVSVLIGFQFRFHPAFRRIRELLDAGVVGAPEHVRVTWGEYLPDWHPWEDWRHGYAARPELGGGAHHTISHPFDYLRMLLGEPLDVRASLATAHPLGLDVAESVDAQIRFAGDVDATVHLDYWSRPQIHRLEMTCESGSIVWDYLAGRLATWSTTRPEWRTEDVPGIDRRDELFVDLATHFLDVVRGHARPVCTLRDGVHAVTLASAIEESSARDGARISLSTEADGMTQ